ncbi:MAG TPA: hypothetical protein VLH60_07665 [Sedimentisphaerales bacterium]|nr:hypothetical protein [Sedimentisphaerales bacterium]
MVMASNLVSNGDFATNLDGWTMHRTIDGDTLVSPIHSTVGYPPGSLRLERAMTNPAASTNGHRFMQWIPVTPGTSYQVRGQWRGDLSAGAVGSNWAEVYIGFTADPNIGQATWHQFRRYRKQWDGVNNINVAASGQWDWENITSSPSGTPPAAFTAQDGQNYMLVAFNLGGSILTPSSAQPFVHFDNIVVIACNAWLAGDANQDCQVNFRDLGILANQWLLCNMDPASACW